MNNILYSKELLKSKVLPKVSEHFKEVSKLDKSILFSIVQIKGKELASIQFNYNLHK